MIERSCRYTDAMEIAERRAYVLERLRTQNRVDVADLAEQLGTSQITVRRDLEHLAAIGALRRVRGGAVATALRGEGTPFSIRSALTSGLKRRLGEAAADLITDGEAVSVDSGTTGSATASALSRRRITAVPLSVQSLYALGGTPSIILPGGEVDPVEGTLGGVLLEQGLRELRLDTALMTCCGVSTADGVMAYNLRDAAAKRAAQRAAARTILIAESTKFGLSALARICAFDDVSVLVSDAELPGAVRDFCSEHDIQLELIARA